MIGDVRSSRPARPRFCGVTALLALVCLAASFAGADPHSNRIVAVGDVHGNYDGLTAILQEAQLIDEDLRWSGGKATLVQVGDLLDRGVALQEVMDLMIRLQTEAADAGGEVVCLLGNHEAMNLLGLVRDVNPEAFGRFADKDALRRRERISKKYARILEYRAGLLVLEKEEISSEQRRHLLDDLPEGKIEYLEALGPNGRYGAWLRSLPIAFQRSGSLFVHGGIGPAMRGQDLAEINHEVEREIRLFDSARTLLAANDLLLPTAAAPEVREVAERVIELDEFLTQEKATSRAALTLRRLASELVLLQGLDDWLLVHPDSPLWFRGTTEWDEEQFESGIATILETLGAKRVVVGHSPRRSGRIEERFDGRVFAIDTGMLSSYYTGGRPSALEIVGETVTAIYGDGREVLSDGDVSEDQERPTFEPWRAWLDPDGNQLPFRTDAEIEEFLLTAEVIENKLIGKGVTNPRKLLLAKDGVQAHAVFKDVDILREGATRTFGKAYMNFRDFHLYEVAAYKVDRLLGLERVPPAVPRKVGHTRGTVQLWLEQTIMDVDRRDRNLSPPDPLRWRQQRQMMEVFDNLIGNSDSNLGNLLIDRTWTLWFIDHTRGFVRATTPLYQEKITYCERMLWEAIKMLDYETVKQELDPYLSPYEIETMMARRNKIVAYIQGMIDIRGEENVIYELLPPGEKIDSWPEPPKD